MIGRGTAAIRAISTTIATILLTLALVTPVLGGGLQCQLLATVGGGSATEVETGEVVLIEGTGFAPGATVFITYLVDGTAVGDEMVTADGTGMFETEVTPQPGQEGTWTVEADAPKQCLAATGFLVVTGPTPAATPSPTPVPTPAPTPAGELPDVATSEPRTPTALLAGAAFLVAAAAWVSQRRLARLVR